MAELTSPAPGDEEIAEELEEAPLPETLPLLPVRDVVVFPYMILPLFVARDNSIAAVEAAMARDQLVFLAAQRDQNVDHPDAEDLHEIGAVGMVMRQLKLPDGRLKVLVQGLTRARISSWERHKPFMEVGIEPLDEREEADITVEVEAIMRNVREASEKILALRGLLSGDVMAILNSVEEPGRLADMVASNLRLKIEEAQEILEEVDPVERLKRVHGHLGKELEVSTMQAKIQSEAKEEMSKSQREYFLREQMRAIRRELGDAEDRHQELMDLRQALEEKAAARGDRQGGVQTAGPPGADAARGRRGHHRAHLPGLDRGPALERLHQGPHGHRPRGPHPGRGPLRPQEGEGAHPGIPGGAQAQPQDEGPHPLPAGPPG